jgi:diaminohydroxyphosphoribosylaminopyrimidine deaminase/5-amino-6-(5-phosphoribosylamino)uracil reductase
MAFSLGTYSYRPPILCKATVNSSNTNHALEAAYIQRAVELADKSAGFTSPHPNFGCLIATPQGKVAGEGYLYAQGAKSAELQALESAGEWSRRATAYINMEPGDCHGDHTAVSALVEVWPFLMEFLILFWCFVFSFF